VLAKKMENHDSRGRSLAKESIHFALNPAVLIRWTELLRTKEHSTLNHLLFQLPLNPSNIFISCSSGLIYLIKTLEYLIVLKKGENWYM
jgi:hypothetical protein